jgi:hypothetical protein
MALLLAPYADTWLSFKLATDYSHLIVRNPSQVPSEIYFNKTKGSAIFAVIWTPDRMANVYITITHSPTGAFAFLICRSVLSFDMCPMNARSALLAPSVLRLCQSNPSYCPQWATHHLHTVHPNLRVYSGCIGLTAGQTARALGPMPRVRGDGRRNLLPLIG